MATGQRVVIGMRDFCLHADPAKTARLQVGSLALVSVRRCWFGRGRRRCSTAREVCPWATCG